MNRRVAIAGMGCSRAGVLSNAGQEDLLVDSGITAIEDAGLRAGDVQASWFGCTTVSANHALLNFSLKLGYTGMTKVSNAGATGADALRAACTAVASGDYDIVLAAGVEKPTDSGLNHFAESEYAGGSAVGASAVLAEFTTAAFSALYLSRYAAHYRIEPATLRAALNRLAARSRRAGAHNPLAALRAPIDEDQLAAAPLAAPPLTVLDCCRPMDGAAAAIICDEHTAARLGRPYVVIEGVGMASGGLEGRMRQGYDFLGLPEVRLAARRACAMAGITDPASQIDHVQVFDLTTGAELLAYEDLGLALPGGAVQAVLDGAFGLEGRNPTNTDGGLLANGYQAGASGIRQVYESFLQLTGRAGERQLPGVRRSLVHSVGGSVGSFSAIVLVLGRPA
jgi:acetyl-CoA C-acetyltransferase